MNWVYLIIIFNAINLVFSAEETCLNSLIPPTFFPILIPYDVNETFTVVELDNSTDAKCLDGTNFKFFFYKGYGSGADKFIINWEGSAFCGSDGYNILDSCYNRSEGEYGTSSQMGDNGTIITTNFPWGEFSSLKEYNPLFHNWNKVLIHSCDGSNHFGYLKDAISYKGKDLWIRGYNNTMSTLEFLRVNYGLFEMSEIMLIGGSSGGTAAFIWISYLQDYFPKNIKLMGVPDAGFFMDTYNNMTQCYYFRYLNQKLADLIQAQNFTLYKKCKYFGTTDIWKCLIPQYMVLDIDIPVFIVNSENDYEQLSNVGGVECIRLNGGPTSCTTEDKDKIKLIREYFLARIFEVKEKKPTWGFYLRSCFEHTLTLTWAWYGSTMDVFNAETRRNGNIKNALYEWYNHGEIGEKGLSSYIDLIDWEHNPFCHF